MHFSIAELRNEARRRIANRPPVVVGLVLLHAAILQQTVLPYLLPGLASTWGWSIFSGPTRSPLAAFFPQLGAASLFSAICFAGLWYSQGWAWLLALYLDVTGLMAGLFTIWRPYSFALLDPRLHHAPLSWPDSNLMLLISLQWVSLMLLFAREIRQHYPVGSFKSIDSTIEKRSAELRLLAGRLRHLARVAEQGDKIIILLIALTQFLASLWWLLMLPFMFNYGGAAAHPNVFAALIAYLLAGIFSACFLVVRKIAARVMSLFWHATIAASVVMTDGINWENPGDKLVGYWTVWVCFAVFYLSAFLAAKLFIWFRRERWGLITRTSG